MRKIHLLILPCILATAGCSQSTPGAAAQIEANAPGGNDHQRVPGPGPQLYGLIVTAYALQWVEIKEGDGALATLGSKLTLNYIGWLEDGTQFYSSYEQNDPITFEYGARQVGLGWDAGGMDGLRVGGKRRIIIPHQLAYGAKGRPPIIPPYSQLTFDVELMKVEPAAAAKP